MVKTSGSTINSVSTDDSEKLVGASRSSRTSNQSKENYGQSHMNMDNAGTNVSNNKISSSPADAALLDLLGGKIGVGSGRSPTRSIGSRNSNKQSFLGSSSVASGHGSVATGTAAGTCTATTATNGSASATSATKRNGITIKVAGNTTATTGNGITNATSPSPFIKMNPRDSASPRRNRSTKSSKSMAFKEYENSIADNNCIHNMLNIDSASIHSWKERGSISSASVQSSSVGGLAFVKDSPNDVPMSPSPSSSSPFANTNHHFEYKQSYSHQYQHYHPTNVNSNASISVSSKSTTSKRSHRSKNSHATHHSTALNSASYNVNNSNIRQLPQEQQHAQQSKYHKPMSISPAKEEQLLFEQRLCGEGHGVAVRKIHSNGKSQLRFVKCISIPPEKRSKLLHEIHKNCNQNMSFSLPTSAGGVPQRQRDVSSSRSVASLMGIFPGKKQKSNLNGTYTTTNNDDGFSPTSQTSISINPNDKIFTKALTWGNKKKVMIPLFKFVAIRKGKSTKRTRRNASDPSKLLSLVTNDKTHGSLDIEAPTTLDRDKFAKAFSVFLNVPLEEGLVGESVVVREFGSASQASRNNSSHVVGSSSRSVRDDMSSLPSTSSYNSITTPHGGREYHIGSTIDGLLPNLTPSPASSNDEPKLLGQSEVGNNDSSDELNQANLKDSDKNFNNNNTNNSKPQHHHQEQNIVDMGSKVLSNKSQDRDREQRKTHETNDDGASEVSSLTQGFDQEIVEELHQALHELRAELEASRAEAARAVKVAEQAIQSAESCTSSDWNSTVTHKAAEAAAQAQKRSAEAIAKQRQAEEKLASEKKSASFWRKQAQLAEEEVGGLQTRLAVAEVERSSATEELEREKRKAASYIQTFKRDYAMSEGIQRETLANAAEQNKLLEIELDGTRRDLAAKAEEVKALQESILEMQNEMSNVSSRDKGKKKFFGMSKKFRESNNNSGRLLLDMRSSSTGSLSNYNDEPKPVGSVTTLHSEKLLEIYAQTSEMRKQFELLRRITQDELQQLPEQANNWAKAASKALSISQIEVTMLKNKLAMEMSNRRKLLGEVQDLRGTVRVYCRPRPITTFKSFDDGSVPTSIVSVPSHEVGLLHREKCLPNDCNIPMSFEYDRMFTSNTTQRELYAEMEDLVLSSLDGYNSCILAFGQSGCGKTHSLIGDFSIVHGQDSEAGPHVDILDCGIHLLAMQQLFTVSKKRSDQFQDAYSMTILEIYEEKLMDLAAEIEKASSSNQSNSGSEGSGSKHDRKLEIRTNRDGETVVQGLVSVPVKTYEDVETLWKQAMCERAKQVKRRGKNLNSYDASSNLIVTLQVLSTNTVTGVGTIGKVQFVDLAASDVVKRRSSFSSKFKTTPTDNTLAPLGNTHEWKYANKSITQLTDVVNMRYQFSRSVPYRNSTLTHLLQDSLESDTKVLLLACVSSDAKDLQNSANTMRFAAKMKKIVVGKATKHTLSFA